MQVYANWHFIDIEDLKATVWQVKQPFKDLYRVNFHLKLITYSEEFDCMRLSREQIKIKFLLFNGEGSH